MSAVWQQEAWECPRRDLCMLVMSRRLQARIGAANTSVKWLLLAGAENIPA